MRNRYDRNFIAFMYEIVKRIKKQKKNVQVLCIKALQTIHKQYHTWYPINMHDLGVFYVQLKNKFEF